MLYPWKLIILLYKSIFWWYIYIVQYLFGQGPSSRNQYTWHIFVCSRTLYQELVYLTHICFFKGLVSGTGILDTYLFVQGPVSGTSILDTYLFVQGPVSGTSTWHNCEEASRRFSCTGKYLFKIFKI